ncbi:hypothetical protein FKM82_008116 [Ascaphus truei]
MFLGRNAALICQVYWSSDAINAFITVTPTFCNKSNALQVPLTVRTMAPSKMEAAPFLVRRVWRPHEWRVQ